MLWARAQFEQSGPREYVRYLMADASDQRGRHFEHFVILEIERARIEKLYQAATTLTNLWRGTGAAVGD